MMSKILQPLIHFVDFIYIECHLLFGVNDKLLDRQLLSIIHIMFRILVTLYSFEKLQTLHYAQQDACFMRYWLPALYFCVVHTMYKQMTSIQHQHFLNAFNQQQVQK
ncbi:unnamed protein product [Paramecium octaurelia]|uniref:Uncharacterized protein n=1 Tax=Paramecium octaurelia TaxID=43137 RepID=A0A8S1UYH0_PAROT|nr:unnamed protein product [Paramecium octaurelia]